MNQMFILGIAIGIFLGFCGASLLFKKYNLRSVDYFKRGEYYHNRAIKTQEETIKINDNNWEKFIKKLKNRNRP